MTFGAWLDRQKRMNGLKQGQVGKDLKISQVQISLYANGGRIPSLDRRREIETYTKGEVMAELEFDWPRKEVEA